MCFGRDEGLLMTSTSPVLHLLCGKIAAGKSTLAAELARTPGTVLIAEDPWLAGLYPGQIATIADYVRCTARLREVMGPHVAALLAAGVNVVLDFPANTVANRAWMRGILETGRAGHRLHVVDVPDEICLARLQARNAGGAHPFAATEAEFRQMTRHFVAPTAEEGFEIVRHGSGSTGQGG